MTPDERTNAVRPSTPGTLAEPGRADDGYAVDPAGRSLTTPPGAKVRAAAQEAWDAKASDRRKVWRVMGAVIGVGIVGSTILNAGAAVGRSYEQEVALSSSLTELRIETGSSDVRVRPIAAGESPKLVARSRSWFGVGEVEVDGSTIRTGNVCGNVGLTCSANFEVLVPASAAITVDGVSGDVTVTGLSGRVEAKVGSGDIELRDLSSREISATASSGDVTVGAGATSRVDARTSSGDVLVRLDSAAQQVSANATSGDVTVELAEAAERVTATASSGDVRVAVPDGADYDTTTDVGSGDITNDVGDTAGAARTIEARATSGDVTLVRR